MSASASDAEDAVQEVSIDLWRNAGRFDPAQGSEANFIAMLARPAVWSTGIANMPPGANGLALDRAPHR